MRIIENEYIRNGRHFYVRNINFSQYSELMGNFGEFIIESNSESDNNPFFSHSFKMNNGVYIFKSKYDSNKAFRIYKDFGDYILTCYKDDKLITNLQYFQDDIKLTEFPTGYVSIGDKVIGQEIPLYNDSTTILNLVNSDKKTVELSLIYKSIFSILDELLKKDIVYSDVHPKNFLFDYSDHNFKLIDFEFHSVSFDGNNSFLYKKLLNNLKLMIMYINKQYGIESFEKDVSFENMEQIKKYLLKKRIIN